MHEEGGEADFNTVARRRNLQAKLSNAMMQKYPRQPGLQEGFSCQKVETRGLQLTKRKWFSFKAFPILARSIWPWQESLLFFFLLEHPVSPLCCKLFRKRHENGRQAA